MLTGTEPELIDAFDWDSLLSQNIELLWKLWHERFMMIMTEAILNSKICMRRNLLVAKQSIV